VAFYGAFLDDGETTIAICMEYCEGRSLEDIYKKAQQLGGVIGETILANIADAVSDILLHITTLFYIFIPLSRFAED
jgi:mitogen-activated protein kinase kinase